ncbi:MAG TPA: hypothetical protein VFP87_01260 [Chitinophagaceae bacterium]|nr:hypothetical protein [Chitinophagaceae bacterium]
MAGVLDAYTAAYPGKLMSKVKITLNDGMELEKKKKIIMGFIHGR